MAWSPGVDIVHVALFSGSSEPPAHRLSFPGRNSRHRRFAVACARSNDQSQDRKLDALRPSELPDSSAYSDKTWKNSPPRGRPSWTAAAAICGSVNLAAGSLTPVRAAFRPTDRVYHAVRSARKRRTYSSWPPGMCGKALISCAGPNGCSLQI